MPKINVDFARGELREKGRTEKDIDTALQLMACIVALDKKTFPHGGINLNFAPSKHKFERIAAYMFPEKDQEEGYTVYVEDISRSIDEARHKILLVDLDGKILYDYKDAPRASFEERMIGIAAHEARHRLQHHRRIRMFSLEDRDVCEDKYLR